MAYSAIRSLANSLLDSIRAAAFVGPEEIRSPGGLERIDDSRRQRHLRTHDR